jgi:putative transposase
MKKEETKKNLRKTKAEKLKIIKEASMHGVRETLDKYGVYPATYYSWKRKFEEMGEEGFAHGMTKERLQKIKELEQEVDLLKQLLAEKELESKLKDDLLKKKYPKVKRKYS